MNRRNLLKFGAPAVFLSATLGMSEWLYQFAFKRVDTVPESGGDNQQYADRYFAQIEWLQQRPKMTWYLNVNDPKNRLVAMYVPGPKATKKTVIISHYYKGDGSTMANFIHLFYDLGYNVLIPDNRGHGKSAGRYINFGWLDRLDYLEWIKRVIAFSGQESQIVLFGVSMGGATVSMTAGEKLPKQVKAVIEDCGYSNLEGVLTFLIHQEFHMPPFPFVQFASQINRRTNGFYLRDVSAIKQLKHNRLPLFVIHGDADKTVPVKMADEMYASTMGDREIWIVHDAIHAESYWKETDEYRRRVTEFLAKYISDDTTAS